MKEEEVEDEDEEVVAKAARAATLLAEHVDFSVSTSRLLQTGRQPSPCGATFGFAHSVVAAGRWR